MIFCGDFVYPFVDFKSSIFQLGEDVIKTPKLLNYESTWLFDGIIVEFLRLVVFD